MTHYSAMIAKLSPIDSAVALEPCSAGKCCREREREKESEGRGGDGGGGGGGGVCGKWRFGGGVCWSAACTVLQVCLWVFLLARRRDVRSSLGETLQQHVHSGMPLESHMPPYAPPVGPPCVSSGPISVRNRTKPKKHPPKKATIAITPFHGGRHVLIIRVNTSPSSVALRVQTPHPPPGLRPPCGLKPARRAIVCPVFFAPLLANSPSSLSDCHPVNS